MGQMVQISNEGRSCREDPLKFALRQKSALEKWIGRLKPKFSIHAFMCFAFVRVKYENMWKMLMNEFEAVHIRLIACNDELCPRLIYFLTSLFFALLFQRDSKIDLLESLKPAFTHQLLSLPEFKCTFSLCLFKVNSDDRLGTEDRWTAVTIRLIALLWKNVYSLMFPRQLLLFC